jgi:lipoprotein-releasing system permease protein
LNLSKLLADKIYQSNNDSKKTAKPVVVIAISGIALGVIAMLLSVMVVTGFKNEISDKVTGFMSAIRVHQLANNNSFEEIPINRNQKYLQEIKKINGVTAIQNYAHKAGILKAKDEIQGVVLKGVDNTFDWNFFKNKITHGDKIDVNNLNKNEALVSKNLCDKLNLKVGDSFLIFFIQEDRKVRKFVVKGIYNTGLSEDFDNLYIFCSMNVIQKVNNWDSTQVAGFEIKVDDLNNIDIISKEIYDKVDYQTNVQTVKEIYPQIFNWLELQNLNVIVIIVLISLIAGTTMISTLLILILENRRPIGLLKALGANDQTLSKTFLSLSSKILIRGLLLGNVIGLGLAYFQLKTGFITLDESSYYIKSVPINFSLTGILLINLGTYLICMLMLLIPGKIISKINPIESLRFD